MKIIIYLSNWNLLGGVETFTKNLYKRMSKYHEITLMYDNVASPKLVSEMQEYCNVIKLEYLKTYDCDIFISSSAWGKSGFESVEAKCYIQMVHADYCAYIKDWNFKYIKNGKTTHHVAVGNHVAKQFEIATPYKIDAVINNLLDNNVKIIPKKELKTLRLVTVSRVSKEKGFERMLKMESLLEGNDYVWDVFGDEKTNYGNLIVPKFKKVKFKGITNEPQKVIQSYDFLVQLSDTEGFPYSVYEALQVHVPVISTDYPSIHELIKDGKNGYIFNMDLSNFVTPKKLKINGFKEKSNEQDWLKLFDSVLKWHEENTIKVRITAVVQKYKISDIVSLPIERALSGIERGLCERI